MSNDCMPGMAMPGCPSSAPAAAGRGGPSATDLALVLVLVLSVYVLGTFAWRHLRRAEIAGYSAFADGFGCVAHALGMIAMSLLMLRTVPTIGPLWAYMVVFATLTVLFLVRAVRAAPDGRRDEVWTAFVHASMVYMFWSVGVVPITAVCLVLYLLFIAEHVRRSLREAPLSAPARERVVAASPNLVGLTGHLAIAAAMMLMLALMQWPAVFR